MPINILMPALSPTMEEGTLAKWHVKEGDSISSGDVIAEIETDKATMEVEAVDEGVVGKILIADGTENVAVNSTIAILIEEGESASDISAPQNGATPTAPSAPKKTVEKAPVSSASPPVAAVTASAPPANGARVFASPLARRIAEQNNIDITAVSGTGPRGRIVKKDVEAVLAGKATLSAPAASVVPAPTGPSTPVPLPYAEGTYDEVKLDGMRKTVAKRLTESKQTVPHFYLTIDCELDKLLAMRKELNATSPEGEEAFKISVNDFIIRASALALKRVKTANASWAGDRILYHHHADIAVAVALDGGLITPVLREAENKGLAEIAREMKDLATRARDRKLMPEEYQGGTFSISNLGMFGIREFSAVINPPHGAILAIGAGEQRPVVRDGALAVATVMTVTLSCDHRVVDGAVGAEFLKEFKRLIQDPLQMML